MYSKVTICTAIAAVFLFTAAGCVTTGGESGGGGWIVVDQPEATRPPPQTTGPSGTGKSKKGQEQAARNHLRSAYRFLQKDKPDHAIKELEKARRKMGSDFWFHYYMGGAYYYKGMHKKARVSWQDAFQYTRDHRLRSRLSTCQSFAVYHLDGDERSIGFLNKAMELDEKNLQARELYRDLAGSRSAGPGLIPDEQVGFMRPGDKKPEKGQKNKNNDGWGQYGDEDDQGENEGDDDRYEKSKDKKHPKGDARGHKKPKKKKHSRKVQDMETFSRYFLIEME